MIPWQLLQDGSCPAHQNMTKDLEIFEAVRKGAIPGAFRTYTWQSPAVTIGHHQRDIVFSDHLPDIPVIRRPTGGGAVLHYDDITFSMASHTGRILPGNISECSLLIARVFRKALLDCGVHTDMRGGDHAYSPVCFDRPSPYELVMDGNKIMGFAIAVKGGFILIQGVIPLRIDHELHSKVFGRESAFGMKGVLEEVPDFSGKLFLHRLRDVLASELGILFQQRHEDDDKHGCEEE